LRRFRPGGDAEPPGRDEGDDPGPITDETSTPAHAAALARVRSILRQTGASDEEINQAVADDVLDMLAVDRMFIPYPRRFTSVELSEMTGLPLDVLKRLWRALGFLDVADDDCQFTELEIEAAKQFAAMIDLQVASVESALQMARVIGSSMARIAEAEVGGGILTHGASGDSVERADAFTQVAGATVPAVASVIEFVWRRHVQAATRRTMFQRARGEATDDGSPFFAVGFADMVGFTILSQHLSVGELSSVVRRFEEISHDVVTGLGGRVVKMIGDEVMFVVDNVVAGAEIGMNLADAYADDELLSDVRVGLAWGPVLVNDGDFYGTTVNLAHRIVNIGNPGTVLMSDEFRQRLLEVAGDRFTGQPLRPRSLKDLGRVQLWWLGRVGEDADGTGMVADRRRNLRWERLAEVLRDLEDFREAGERLLTSGRRGTPEEEAARSPAISAAGQTSGQPGGRDLEGS
jgi:adenylate cyclase